MFTGLIEDIGTVKALRNGSGYRELDIESELICSDLKPDDSVAANGICLTVVRVNSPVFTVQAVRETLSRSTLGFWKSGKLLNLERAVRADARLGGHIVQGHVDGTADLISLHHLGENSEFTFLIPEDQAKFTVEKGSITIDGVSLTIARKNGREISVSLIPHSLRHTLFREYAVGDTVNMESDIFGKYVWEMGQSRKALDRETLKNWGYTL